MANTNTPSVAKNAAPLVNPITTAVQFSQLVLNTLATAPVYSPYVTVPVFNTSASTTSQTATLTGSHTEAVNTIVFRLRAWGRVTGGTTTNFTPSLMFGRSTTYGSNTVVGALTARAFNTLSGMWEMDAFLFWDVTSGVISGSFGGFNGSTAAIDAAALITPITGQTATVLAANLPQPNAFFFSIAGLFSATSAANVAYLDGFQVEDI